MNLSYLKAPPPRVEEILTFDHELKRGLWRIWDAARVNPSAFFELEPLLISGQLDGFGPHNELASHLLAYRPPGAPKHSEPKPMDTYVLEIFKGFWNLACRDRWAFQRHQLGSEAIAEAPFSDGRYASNRELTWIVHKLQTAAKWRLSQSRSGTCPVNRLPLEVISMIFGLLSEANPRHRDVYGNHLWDKCAYLRVREVSRDWKAIADGTPQLWVNMVQDFGPSMTALALRQSKNLTVEARVYSYIGWTASHDLLFQYLPRIGNIHIEHHLPYAFEKIPQLLRHSPAPCLTSITLNPGFDLEGRRRIVIEADVFQAVPPVALQRVKLIDMTIRLPSPLFPRSLIYLKLVRCDVWQDMDSLIDALASMPLLEVFKWHMGLSALSSVTSPIRFPDTMFSVPTRQPATLSCLCLLDLESPMACIAALMTHIAIPPSCRVDVVDDYTLTGELIHDHNVRHGLLESLGVLGHHLSRTFQDRLAPGYDTIRFEEHPFAMKGLGAVYIEGRMNKPTHPRFTVGLFVADRNEEDEDAGRIDEDTLSRLLDRILQFPEMRSATSFETNHECLASPVLWTTILDNLVQVNQLHLEDTSESNATDAIVGLSRAMRNSPTIAPTLEYIHLDHMSFPPSHQTFLAEAAKARSAAGCGPLFLEPERCSDVGRRKLEDTIRNSSGGALNLVPPPAELVF